MRRILAVCLLPLVAATSTQAVADSGPGCGLGQQIFAGQTGLGPHVLAATTNTTFYNQLFGLSFDSLGCNGEAVITAEYQRNVFVAGNFDNIARDAAQGGGQHLLSLASLMNMTEQDTEQFIELTQQQYEILFGQPVENIDAWLIQLDAALEADPFLSHYAMTSA